MTEGRKRASEENAKMVKGIFCDTYNFYRKYHGRLAEPGMWDEATDDFGLILRKYNGETMCARIMLAVFSQLEEETR